ncbi:MAG: selenocysteine-specific translation elongation factor [Chloroflexi bacterium]|nr:selenocysteine-specific translation elongation factor [Chloroflexota bacterium]
MYVIGTAGHVDHGKSSLVTALTGIDPDRLAEEKARGLTIELGFAWLTLPSGREVSIVDVPGHERFIKNMLAGVGGIDLALFVVAADEGVMPQSREHLAILDLLQVRHGVVALTKSDLVEEDWIDLVEADVRELLAPTSLAQAPIVRCSSVSGGGLDALRGALDGTLDALPAIRDVGRPRLPIDRVFTISGFGTVVTGTLIDGALEVGQRVVIEPGGQTARIRGLQSHKKQVEQADPGTRTAVNLSGVSPDDLQRGQVLTMPGWLQPTRSMDVRLRVISEAPRALKHNTTLTLHTGAAEVSARVRLLEGDELPPGDEQWAQLRLEKATPAARGDFFVLRSSEDTVGGGRIVDTRPRRHRRNEAETLQALARLLEGSPDDALLTVLQRLEPVSLSDLRTRSEMEAAAVDAILERQIAEGGVVVLDEGELSDQAHLATAAGFEALASQTRSLIEDFVSEHPLRSGIPKEELRSRLGLPNRAFTGFERKLAESGQIVSRERALDLPERSVALTDEQERAAVDLVARLKAAGARPEGGDKIDAELAAYLEAQGEIVRIADGILLAAPIHAEMVRAVSEALAGGGEITLAEARDLLGTSRKIAQAFLEDLDQRQVTRRVGDARVLRRAG